MPTNHDKTALLISRQHGVKYNRGKGPDVITSVSAIEVETADTVHDGNRQLQGYRKKVYIAGSDSKATTAALLATQETTIGVMDSQGNILKESTRR